jgi:hypothetical protein
LIWINGYENAVGLLLGSLTTERECVRMLVAVVKTRKSLKSQFGEFCHSRLIGLLLESSQSRRQINRCRCAIVVLGAEMSRQTESVRSAFSA